MASTKMKVSQELPRTTKVNSAMFPVLIFHLRLNNLVSKVDATFDSPESNLVSVSLKFKSSLWKLKPKYFFGEFGINKSFKLSLKNHLRENQSMLLLR